MDVYPDALGAKGIENKTPRRTQGLQIETETVQMTNRFLRRGIGLKRYLGALRKLRVVDGYNIAPSCGEFGQAFDLGNSQSRFNIADTIILPELQLFVIPIAFIGVLNEAFISRNAVLGK